MTKCQKEKGRNINPTSKKSENENAGRDLAVSGLSGSLIPGVTLQQLIVRAATRQVPQRLTNTNLGTRSQKTFPAVELIADPGSVAQKCAHSFISSANPGSLTRKCTHLIEAEDDDGIVVKWSGDGTILTNLEPKVRVRAVRQAEDLLGKLNISGQSQDKKGHWW